MLLFLFSFCVIVVFLSFLIFHLFKMLPCDQVSHFFLFILKLFDLHDPVTEVHKFSTEVQVLQVHRELKLKKQQKHLQ